MRVPPILGFERNIPCLPEATTAIPSTIYEKMESRSRTRRAQSYENGLEEITQDTNYEAQERSFSYGYDLIYDSIAGFIDSRGYEAEKQDARANNRAFLNHLRSGG